MAAYIAEILTLTLVVQTHQAPNYIPTYLFLTRVGPCQGDATVIRVNEMTITRQQYNFSVSGRLNITRDIPEGWLIRATMQKCQDIRNMDTCDHFKSYTAIENACTEDELADDKALYESVFNISTPRLSCPIKAGIYQIKNYPFVTRDNHLMVSESKISTSVFGYTFRLDGYSEDEKIMCVEAYMQLVYSRNQLGKGYKSENNESAEEKLAGDDDDDDNDEDDDPKSNGDSKGDTETGDSKIGEDHSEVDVKENEDNSKASDDEANNADSNADDDKAYDGVSDSDGTQSKGDSKIEDATRADNGDSDDLTPNDEDDDTTGDDNADIDEGDESE